MKSVGVSDQSGVAEARRAATDLAGKAGFTEVETGKLALIATELSTNLVKHGSGGEILVGTYEDNEGHGIEILALQDIEAVDTGQAALDRKAGCAEIVADHRGQTHVIVDVMGASARVEPLQSKCAHGKRL